MQDLNDKITGGTLTAAEWNEVPSELQNVIEALGITLSSGDLNQLGKAIASYAAAGQFYSDSGVADAYVLDAVSTRQALVALAAQTDGAVCRFRPGNANTGASTVNVNGLGVKDIVREDGTALSVGDLITTRDAYIRWDQAADDFRLLNMALATPTGINFSGAKARLTSDVVVGSGGQEITMDTEDFDDGGWFAASSTDLVVPAGVTRVLVVANLEQQGSPGLDDQVGIRIYKNGAEFDGDAYQRTRQFNSPANNVSLIDSCTAGDTYSLFFDNQSGVNRTVEGTNGSTWIACTALQAS